MRRIGEEPNQGANDLSEAMHLLGNSIQEWRKTITSVEFKPPEVLDRLQERCERILWLLKTKELSSFEAAIRRVWLRKASESKQHIEDAVDARHQYLHPMATERRRKLCLLTIEFHLDQAYAITKKLAEELERDRIIKRGAPKAEERYAASIRALHRVNIFLGHPEKWCKGAEAKNKQGIAIDWSDGRAVSFSITGALRAACQGLSDQDRRNTFTAVGDAASCANLPELQAWNDKLGTSHGDILKTLSNSIRILERNELRQQHTFDL